MDCVELLEQMVSIPSESQNEEAFARFLCSYLHDELGMESELQHIAGKSYNVLGYWKETGTPSRRLLLGGHIDTVVPTTLENRPISTDKLRRRAPRSWRRGHEGRTCSTAHCAQMPACRG